MFNKKEKNKSKISFTKKLSTRYGVIVLATTFILFAVMIAFISNAITKQIESITYSFAEGITEGRAGEIQNWIDIYESDLRVYANADINKTGDKEQVINWLHENTDLRNLEKDDEFISRNQDFYDGKYSAIDKFDMGTVGQNLDKEINMKYQFLKGNS